MLCTLGYITQGTAINKQANTAKRAWKLTSKIDFWRRIHAPLTEDEKRT